MHNKYSHTQAIIAICIPLVYHLTQNHPIHSYFKERGGSTNLNQPLYTYIQHILYYYAKPLYYIYAKYHAWCALCIFRLPYGTRIKAFIQSLVSPNTQSGQQIPMKIYLP